MPVLLPLAATVVSNVALGVLVVATCPSPLGNGQHRLRPAPAGKLIAQAGIAGEPASVEPKPRRERPRPPATLRLGVERGSGRDPGAAAKRGAVGGVGRER